VLGEVETLLGVNVVPLSVPNLGIIKFPCDSYFVVDFVSYTREAHSIRAHQQGADFEWSLPN